MGTANYLRVYEVSASSGWLYFFSNEYWEKGADGKMTLLPQKPDMIHGFLVNGDDGFVLIPYGSPEYEMVEERAAASLGIVNAGLAAVETQNREAAARRRAARERRITMVAALISAVLSVLMFGLNLWK